MDKLIRDIVRGDVPAGELLEREVDMAERFDVSRGVARECVRALEERGLVTVRHGRGAAVNTEAEWHRFDPDVLTALLDRPDHDQSLDDALTCRRVGEIEAAALAAKRGDREGIQRIWAAFWHMEACAARAAAHTASAELFDEADLDFHQAVIQASGNLMLGQIIAPVHQAIARAHPPADHVSYDRIQEEHRLIVEAIEARQPERAGDAMRNHLDSLAKRLRRGGPERRNRVER